jgi:hypothetical protein
MRLATIVGSFTVLGLCACTHLVQESTQQVHVSSQPSGAAVYVSNVRQPDITPTVVTLDPRRTHEVRVEKECYASYRSVLRPGMGLRTYGTVQIPVSQLDTSVHAQLQPMCAPMVRKEER